LGLLKISLCVTSANPPTTYLNASWKLYSALGFSTKLNQPSAGATTSEDPSTPSPPASDENSSEPSGTGLVDPTGAPDSGSTSRTVQAVVQTEEPVPPKDENNGISVGAIAGIAIGGVAVAGLAIGIIVWLVLRNRRNNRENGQVVNPPAPVQQYWPAQPPAQQPIAAYAGMNTKVELPGTVDSPGAAPNPQKASFYEPPVPRTELQG
jgi:hypothetical protein